MRKLRYKIVLSGFQNAEIRRENIEIAKLECEGEETKVKSSANAGSGHATIKANGHKCSTHPTVLHC